MNFIAPTLLAWLKTVLLCVLIAVTPAVLAGAGSDSGGSDSGGSDSGGSDSGGSDSDGSSDSPKSGDKRRRSGSNISGASDSNGGSSAGGTPRYRVPEVSDAERKRFIRENRESIEIELARSQGEVLIALGELYQHDESEVVRRLAKDLELLTAATDDQFVAMVHGWLLSKNR